MQIKIPKCLVTSIVSLGLSYLAVSFVNADLKWITHVFEMERIDRVLMLFSGIGVVFMNWFIPWLAE